MKISELLLEAKSRISHPEDMIFDEGVLGAKNALDTLLHAANTTENITVKYDGSPALIIGYDEKGFILTDKSGFAKHVLPHTSKEVYNMIFNRFPDQLGRGNYATLVSRMFNYCKKLLPTNFKGFIQFDVMWFNTPVLRNEFYEFKPNKVLYKVPAQSNLGKEISSSQMGIVINSYFNNINENEPHAINDLSSLNLNNVPGLAVLSTKMNLEIKINKKLILYINKIKSFLNKENKSIIMFFDKSTLQMKKISNLPNLMKQFLAVQASHGSKNITASEFVNWINLTSLTESKRKGILDYIYEHLSTFNKIWAIVINIIKVKNELLKNLSVNSGQIQANIGNYIGHEGFVIDSPNSKIKLVNRPVFMRKD